MDSVLWKGDRTDQRVKLGCDAVPVKASASNCSYLGNLWSWLFFPTCLNLGGGWASLPPVAQSLGAGFSGKEM